MIGCWLAMGGYQVVITERSDCKWSLHVDGVWTVRRGTLYDVDRGDLFERGRHVCETYSLLMLIQQIRDLIPVEDGVRGILRFNKRTRIP